MKKLFILLVAVLLMVITGCSSGSSDNVTPAASSDKAILSFSLNGVAGVINEKAKTITVTVPYGTDVTNLVATYTTTGSSVKVYSILQTDGTSTNDFTNPVPYTVTADNGSTQDYIVTIILDSSSKLITEFSLNGVEGTINEAAKTIAVTMPYLQNVTKLVATFTTTGASVKVGSIIQKSGTTANDFTSQVTYTVTAADWSTQDYIVTVTVAASSSCQITAYSLSGVVGTIDESNTPRTISVTLPYGTSVTKLVATYTTTGASVKVGSTVQTSGSTANNFTSPVTYTVTAADASTMDYIVTVKVVATPSYSISGTLSGYKFSGETIWLEKEGSDTVYTSSNASGYYIFTGVVNGTYTVRPYVFGNHLHPYWFIPSSKIVTISGANVGNINFTSTDH